MGEPRTDYIYFGWQMHKISEGFTRNWKHQLFLGGEQDGRGIKDKEDFFIVNPFVLLEF